MTDLSYHKTAETTRSATDAFPGDIPPPENKIFYPALDGLRAIAVLLVFWGHYEGPAHPLLSWGWAGVDYFFVLSGFLITGILYDTRNQVSRFSRFYARRSLRIFPLYYGVLLLALALTPIFHWDWNRAWFLWFTYLGNYARFLFIHTAMAGSPAIEHLVAQPPFPHPFIAYTGHFWSLCVEEQFYLVWPLIVFSIRRRTALRNLCAGICVLCLIGRIVAFHLLPADLLNADFLGRVTPFRADALLLGGLIALCLRGPEAESIQKCARPLLAVFVAGFVIFELTCLVMSPGHTVYQPDLRSPILSSVGLSLIDLSAGLLILSIIPPGGLLFGFFNLRWLRGLGRISYGFYVFHDLLHQPYAALAHILTHHRGPSVNLTACIGLIGTTCIAWLSFEYFEKPFLKLKRFFSDNASEQTQ